MDLNKSKLFEEAKTAKRLPGIFGAIFLLLVFLIGGQSIGTIVLPLVNNIVGDNIILSTLFEHICNFIFISLLIFAVVKFIEKRKISTLGFHKENFVIKYLIGFGIGFLMFSIVVLILKLTGNVEVELNPGVPSGMAALSGILIVIPGWMIQSATEEILTRGWLMNVLGAKYNAAIALIVSASVFGVLHLMNPGVTPIAIINIILVGLFFGLYAIKTNHLWGVCGIHAAWNWAQGNVYGFEVSGNAKSAIGSFIHLKSTGTNWITGGSFGPEAGIAATIILVLATIILCFVWSKKIKDNM